MLRPDGDLAREVELGEVTRVIADPERAAFASERLPQVPLFVLGGGGGPRDLGVPGVVDLEQIDPGLVEPPAWYEPNPGRGADLAFVLFTGEGAGTHLNRVSKPPLGAECVRHRNGCSPDRSGHGLLRDSAIPRLGADDEHRRRRRRRIEAGDDRELRPADLLAGGSPVRRHRRVLHVDDAARAHLCA